MEEENVSNQTMEELKKIVESSDNQLQKTEQKVQVLSSRNRKIGLSLIIGPFLGVIFALIGVVIIKAVQGLFFSDTSGNLPSGSIGNIVANLINWILILIGVVSVIGFIIGIPVGIIYLCKRDLVDGVNYDERSGDKENSIVPTEIKGWNWGAAGLTWVWGISQGVWISLLAFIPIVNIFMWIFLGIKGNELAWKSQKWESVDAFISYQKKWRPWGIVFFVISILGLTSKFFDVK